jgi:hypothetical protein
MFAPGETGEPLPQPDPGVSEQTETPTPTETPDEAAADDAGSDPPRNTSDGGAFLPVALAVGLFAGVGLLFRRLGYQREGFWLVHPNLPDIPPAFVQRLLGAIPRTTMGVVVGLSATLPRVLDDTMTVVGAAGSAAAMVVRGTVRGTVATVAAVPAAFAAGTSGLATGLGRALGALPGAISSLGGQTNRDWSSSDSSSSGSSDGNHIDAEHGPLTVEEAWAKMTDRVPIRNRDTITPGQYAREAVRRGLPSRAVGTLTRAFQEVRYGDRPSTDERLGAARDAYDDIDGGDDEE